MIRHITSLDNINNGKIVDSLKIKHATITALKINELSGWVDPATHLNLDFFSHLIKDVVVAEKLEKNAKIVLNPTGTFFAIFVDRSSYQHYGMVDVYGRMQQFKEAISRKKDEK